MSVRRAGSKAFQTWWRPASPIACRLPARDRASIFSWKESGMCAAPSSKPDSIVKAAFKMPRANMVNLSQDIHPLTDFKRNTSDFIRRMKKTKRPLVLTLNGKAELVVQDAKTTNRPSTGWSAWKP